MRENRIKLVTGTSTETSNHTTEKEFFSHQKTENLYRLMLFSRFLYNLMIWQWKLAHRSTLVKRNTIVV